MIDERERYERAFGLFDMPEPSWDRLIRRRERRRRNQRIAAGAVGIAVFVAAIWIVLAGSSFDRSTPAVSGPVPPGERVGFIGLPPPGAEPSTPVHGDLVLSMIGRSASNGGGLFRAWVYADGRLIWTEEGDFPYGANDTHTGVLEQRLTPEGIEQMRTALLSTGLFDHDVSLLSSNRVAWGEMRVRGDDGFTRVSWSNAETAGPKERTPATAEQDVALRRLDELLVHPSAWLPSGAWEDEQLRAYVPSAFEVCSSAERGVAASRILGTLPAEARDLLLAAKGANDPYCSTLTTEEARTLAGILDAAEIPRDERSIAARLGYRFEPPYALAPGPTENWIDVSFEPYLPHGPFPCSVCG